MTREEFKTLKVGDDVTFTKYDSKKNKDVPSIGKVRTITDELVVFTEYMTHNIDLLHYSHVSILHW